MTTSKHRIINKVEIGHSAKEALELALAAIAEDREDADPEAEPPGDPLEMHELQAEGDSSSSLDPSESPIDFEPTAARTWYQLGEFLCPPVRYWLDERGQVHPMRSPTAPSVAALVDAVARAVARHLEPDLELIRVPLGWCHIPALGSTDALLPLTAHDPGVDLDDLRAQLKRRGKVLLSFGVLLPSGECITPNTLIKPASKTKRASLAGALRMASMRPEQLAGETWTKKDWVQFERAQKESESSRASSGGARGKTRL
jgi:hypothetical protein